MRELQLGGVWTTTWPDCGYQRPNIGPGVKVWNIFGSPVLERFTHCSLCVFNCIHIFGWYVLSHKSDNWLIEKGSIMLMTMTHHDSGMWDTTARRVCRAQDRHKFQTYRMKEHSVESDVFRTLCVKFVETIFFYPILFAICTSTFSKLCFKNNQFLLHAHKQYIKIQSVPHRKHITSPLQSTTG
jgi:hypothetical protein